MAGRRRPRIQSGELKQLVDEMERCIKALGAPPVKAKEAFLQYQHDQVDGLVAMEDRFKQKLLAHKKAKFVYDAFVDHVYSLPSSMSARSYFRERQETIKDTLGPALQNKDMAVLAKYRFNYRFIQWSLTLKVLDGSFHKLAAKIRKLRHEMVLLLMPLAINRTRLFCGRTTKTHLMLKDQAQVAFEGLITTVDKYTPPFSQVYRAVAVGRILGNQIEYNNHTLLHFLPDERKILYRAHKLAGRAAKDGGMDHETMAARLNEEAEGEFVTDAFEVASLLTAATHVSADAGTAVGGARKDVTKLAAPAEQAPDVQVEHSEAMDQVKAHLHCLTLVERKLLAFKGMIEPEDVGA